MTPDEMERKINDNETNCELLAQAFRDNKDNLAEMQKELKAIGEKITILLTEHRLRTNCPTGQPPADPTPPTTPTPKTPPAWLALLETPGALRIIIIILGLIFSAFGITNSKTQAQTSAELQEVKESVKALVEAAK